MESRIDGTVCFASILTLSLIWLDSGTAAWRTPTVAADDTPLLTQKCKFFAKSLGVLLGVSSGGRVWGCSGECFSLRVRSGVRSVKWLSTYPCPKDQTAWCLENDMASGVSLLGACRMILLAAIGMLGE